MRLLKIPHIKQEKAIVNHYVLEDGLLYRKHHEKLLFVMPKSMWKGLTVTAHDLSGHPSIEMTV